VSAAISSQLAASFDKGNERILLAFLSVYNALGCQQIQFLHLYIAQNSSQSPAIAVHSRVGENKITTTDKHRNRKQHLINHFQLKFSTVKMHVGIVDLDELFCVF
jgi:hypothetical protein